MVLLKRCAVSCTIVQYWAELCIVEALMGSSMSGTHYLLDTMRGTVSMGTYNQGSDSDFTRQEKCLVSHRGLGWNTRDAGTPRGRSWESQPSGCDLNDVTQADRRCVQNKHTVASSAVETLVNT